jgi:ribose transport system permease protein
MVSHRRRGSIVRVGMTFIGANIFVQQMAFGGVLIIAVAITIDCGKTTAIM